MFCDSSIFITDGDIVHITETRAFPLSEFCKIRVNLESRNGMCPLLHKKKSRLSCYLKFQPLVIRLSSYPLLFSVSLEITVPNVSKLKNILKLIYTNYFKFSSVN